MQPMTKKERIEQQEELKRKVNKLFDTRASSPLIINKLKKTDTVLNKVNNINEDYFASRGKVKHLKIYRIYCKKEECSGGSWWSDESTKDRGGKER